MQQLVGALLAAAAEAALLQALGQTSHRMLADTAGRDNFLPAVRPLPPKWCSAGHRCLIQYDSGSGLRV